jgi:hypothetical protein
LQRAQADSHLPADADVAALAAYFGTVMSGSGVQAKAGAALVKLESIGRAAISVRTDD